jgi:hypothetical protein
MSSLIANRSKSIPNVIRFVNRCPKLVCTQDKREPFGIADSTSEDFPTKARQPRKAGRRSAADEAQPMSVSNLVVRKKAAKPKIQPAKPAI